MDLRPPDLDAYAATGGPVDRNNPLTTFVVAGSRITIVRSVIGLLPCGQAQPFTSNTRLSNSAQPRRSSARAVVSRLSSAFTRLSAARAARSACVDVGTLGTTSARSAALPASTPA